MSSIALVCETEPLSLGSHRAYRDLKPENVLLSLRPPSHPKSGDHDSGNLNREVPTVLPHRYTAKVCVGVLQL
jgi:hypothetical protein